MNIFKSHFWYNKRQRNGILFLIFLIIVLQLLYVFNPFSSDEQQDTATPQLLAFQKEIDSLKLIALEKRKPKIYPFNPNYINDYKGYQLGMSTKEIDRLLQFRKQNKWINSVKDFKKVTQVSDSLLNKISPYFKFPDWVLQRNKKQKSSRSSYAFQSEDDAQQSEIPTKIIKININTATFKEVLKIPEIDYQLCKKIFDYRDEIAEFQDIAQLKNIEGFPLEKYDRIVLYLFAK